MDPLPSFLETVRAQIDARLTEALDAAQSQADTLARLSLPVVAQLRALTMRGGKRLRPAMLVAAVECVTPWGECAQAAIDAGAALELLQSYLLIHDDWMDQDAFRRGGPTVHVALGETYGDAHRGNAAAILAGDLGSALAQDLVASAPMPADRLGNAMRAFVAMQREVVLGQILDLLDAPDIDSVHDLKTGSYTVRGPLVLGHAVAGGSAEALASLVAFARPLGIAFQLRDDIIGTYGDEKETGKPAGGDLRSGKRTAPVAYALTKLDEAGRRELESLLGSADNDALPRARALLERVGAREAIEARIVTLRDEAVAALQSPALRPEGRVLLGGLARAITDRKK